MMPNQDSSNNQQPTNPPGNTANNLPSELPFIDEPVAPFNEKGYRLVYRQRSHKTVQPPVAIKASNNTLVEWLAGSIVAIFFSLPLLKLLPFPLGLPFPLQYSIALIVGSIGSLLLLKGIKHPLWGLAFGLAMAVALIAGGSATYGLFGLALLTIAWQLLFQRQSVQRSPLFMTWAGFALLSLIALKLYASEFVVGLASTGYASGFLNDAGQMPAKVIVAIWALTLPISYALGFRVFQPIKRLHSLNPWWALNNWGLALALISFYTLLTCLPAFVAIELPHYDAYFIPLLFLNQWLTGWLQLEEAQKGVMFKLPPFKKASLTQAMGFITVIYWIIYPVFCNKTNLIGVVLGLALQGYLGKKAGLGWGWGWPKWPKLSATQTLGGLLLGLLLLSSVWFGTSLSTLVTEKLTYFIDGFSRVGQLSQGTLKIRLDNWSLLLDHWQRTATLQNTLIGHGIGASRNDIFYLSAQRRWNYGILVQTVHNVYLELFYDYGLLALLYFTPWLLLLKTAWQRLKSPVSHPIVKHASLVIGCLILYVALYGLLDGLVIQFMIELLTVLGLLHGVLLFWPLNLTRQETLPGLKSLSSLKTTSKIVKGSSLFSVHQSIRLK
jgi:hypothetical protein